MEHEQMPQLIMTSGSMGGLIPPEDRKALYLFLEKGILPDQIYVVDDKTPYVVYRNMHFYGLEVIEEFVEKYKNDLCC